MQTAPSSRRRPAGSPAAFAAHQYYERDAQEYVVDLFNRTAQHYNTVERLFLNGGLWYRRFG